MSSVINADTTNGIVITSDTSGEIKLQSAGTDIATVNSSGVSATTFIPTSSTVPTNGVYLPTTNTVGLATNNAERMRIDSGGNVLVGTASQIGPAKIVATQSTTGWAAFACNHTLGAGERFLAFANAANNALIGTITNNGNTATSYNTTSDYRLKENIVPMTGALDKVLQLKPVTFTWKETGNASQGFIAHELQAIVPDCVTGEKDAIETYTDEEGNEQTRIKPQGVDTSFLVATLTAAIQEQQDIIKALETRIQALENA